MLASWTPLESGILVRFGSREKDMSFSGQRMSSAQTWSVLPAIVSKKVANCKKMVRGEAGYVHVGDGRIVISGGMESQPLKMV